MVDLLLASLWCKSRRSLLRNGWSSYRSAGQAVARLLLMISALRASALSAGFLGIQIGPGLDGLVLARRGMAKRGMARVAKAALGA